MSKLYDLLYSLIGKVNKAVKTETQVLTEEQKTQARANIGAMSSNYTPPNQTAEQVGADPKGTATSAVSAHNTNGSAHTDIRNLISELSTKVNNFLDSDDTTLDELSELITAIKDNKNSIESITSGKVNVTDIVNDLVTNNAKKPLSAAQGVALKGLIDNLTTAIANKPDLTESEINTLSAMVK
jgi:hypothetical protein